MYYFGMMSTRPHPLRLYRERHGLSQAQLASLASITQGALGHIELGRRRPSPDLALKFERVTNNEVTHTELLYFEEVAA